MEAIENIIKRIQEDADWKIKEYQQKAEREIERIRKIEEGKWEREKEKMENVGKREAETIRQMYVSKAHLDGKKMLMNAREKVIERIIGEMLSKFKEYGNYDAYLEDSILAVKEILGDEFNVVCMKEDIPKVKGIVEKLGLKISVMEGDVEYGGILAVSKDSLKKVDYTARAFIERNLGNIRKRIYVRLFGEEHA
jgi:V/A-type H+-transporting ATPase subunit E